MSVAAGEVVHEPQTVADRLFFIHRGQVRQYKMAGRQNSRLLEILGPDEWFGAAALAGVETYGSRAVAVTGSIITELRTERLVAAMARHPGALLDVNRQLAARLLAAQDDAARLVFEDCHERLINALLRFSRSAASARHEDGVVLRITHDQLAQYVGVARETVSLALTTLRQQNLLRTGRNQLVFNPDALRQFRQQAPAPLQREPEAQIA